MGQVRGPVACPSTPLRDGFMARRPRNLPAFNYLRGRETDLLHPFETHVVANTNDLPPKKWTRLCRSALVIGWGDIPEPIHSMGIKKPLIKPNKSPRASSRVMSARS